MAEFAPRQRRWLVALAILLGVLVGHVETLSSVLGATTYAYDAPAIARVGAHADGDVAFRLVQIGVAREVSASTPAEARGTSTSSSGSVVATDTGGVLKGAIPDVAPSNLTEQLALTEARASGGTQIMANLVDNPRLVAVYGDGECVKIQSVLRGTDANTTVHCFKNLTTGLEVEFKFK
jgi:hypothetical protein